MYIRIKRGGNKAHPHDYLQIVESYREGSSVRQRVIATLGRLDQLRAEGHLDGLIKSLCRFSETLRGIDAFGVPEIDSCCARLWGPPLVFGRLWERQGIPGILQGLVEGRRLEFDLERVSFALSLQRLMEPGSDLQGSRWVRTVEASGFEEIELQHLYRFTEGLGCFRIFGNLWRSSFTFISERLIGILMWTAQAELKSLITCSSNSKIFPS